jgi:hypothetical protein
MQQCQDLAALVQLLSQMSFSGMRSKLLTPALYIASGACKGSRSIKQQRQGRISKRKLAKCIRGAAVRNAALPVQIRTSCTDC